MMHHRTKKHHYYMRSLILLGFSLVLAHLLWTGSITFYLAPRLHTLCYVTFVILLLLTGSSFWQIRQAKNQSEEICDCGGLHRLPSSRWSSTFVYGLFLLPVFMGLFMPDKVLDSAIAKQKGINLLQGDAKKLLSKETEKNRVDATNNSVDLESSSSQANTSASTNPTTTTGPNTNGTTFKRPPTTLSTQEVRKMFEGFGDFYQEFATSLYQEPVLKLTDQNFLDGLTVLSVFTHEFDGHPLELMGFVYRQPNMQENEFVVARFSVSCCTADAQVSGVLVQSPNAKEFKTDSWVKVNGALGLTTYEGNELLVLQAKQISQVPAPKDPYVYYSALPSN
ncbi:TIGR03943 family putative permease subunit [Brevibacillus laterosporus]|uniref:TIGR03943 family protein n=1 Tax=Brevibacillus laterosporus TaxID=1465 RepID=A0AAP8QFC9_BRELA|nr:TIGR03943 family protein [Brevibacillus laterosporus]MCR8979813.1 TIGR03943 family protein [Brevibacillus laterosporus]MCZ0806968.1 TIGR03943 family protein [Brevibacillus laterosporus]MCZ0825243.1 TIGR03943 family protein [Brevibacillus laterosporus]MCZ0849940.1 TIGR03943 family protein [Brevibacillus laterosporus]PPB08267.1 TIGR03943 family protein [Brevibacillus laterosporus]